MPRRPPLPGSSPAAPRAPAAPGRLLLAACLGSLLAAAGSAQLRNGECGEPKDVAHAAIPKGSSSRRLRYTCDKPCKRQAGTSSLTVCEQDPLTKEFRWSEPQLKCIRIEKPTAAPPEASEGSQTVSLPTEASSSADPPLTTTKPSSESSVPTAMATPEAGPLAPSPASDDDAPLQSTTPNSRAETSKALEVPKRAPPTSSAPSRDAVGGSSEIPSGSPWQRNTGSLLFKIGSPLIVAAAGIILGLTYCCYRRWRNLQRLPAFPPVELTSIDAPTLDGGGPEETSSPDPGSVNEKDPMLSSHGITPTG